MSQEAITFKISSGLSSDVQSPITFNWNSFDPLDSASLVMSPAEFRDAFLNGVPLCNTVTGQRISDQFYKDKILQVQREVENMYGIKLFKQTIFETKDFVREEFMNWGFIRTSWQINEPCRLRGSITSDRDGNGVGLTYPKEWLSVKRSNSNDNQYWKQLQILPNGHSMASFDNLVLMSSQYFTFYGARIIPNYWKIWYITGFDRIPDELINLIGIKVAINVLPQLEMIVGNTASTFGSASNSLSLDGLSQSSSRMQGGNIFKGRLDQYIKQYATDSQMLRGIYKGISFTTC